MIGSKREGLAINGKNTETRSPGILYQDAHIIACVKAVGTDSQCALPSVLSSQLGREVFCVHRLDRSVGGVMVYARTKTSAAALSKAISDGKLDKRYLAVCAGRPEADAGEMRDLLFHDASKNKTYIVKRERKGVREAVLEYRVWSFNEECSLVEVHLQTGRSHQIRVQFASRGMPLLGDVKYGSKIRSGNIALWSHVLAFPHPASGEMLRLVVPPPVSEPWTRFDVGGDSDS